MLSAEKRTCVVCVMDAYKSAVYQQFPAPNIRSLGCEKGHYIDVCVVLRF